MLIHLIKNTVFWLNALPARDGVSSTHSPRYLMTGQELNYNNHVRLEFGEYVQTHEEHTNNMNKRTMGAICLGPTGNQQGSHWFLSLATGARVSCRRWTQLPRPREVIHRINELGKQQRMPLTITFGDCHGREIEDRLVDVDDDDSSEDDYDPHFDDHDDASDDDLSYDTDDDPDDDDRAPGGNGYPGHQHQLADVLDHEHENAPAIGENGAIDEGHEEDDASVTSSESGGESIDDQEALNNAPLDPIGPADEPVDEPGETHETPGVGNIGHADEPGKVHETPGVGDIGYGEPGVNAHIEGDAVEAENAGVEDPDGSESQSESETKSDAFARAEASGRQQAVAGMTERPTQTNRGKTKDPAFEYLHTLFGSTDPETVFTLLTGRKLDHILSFLTEQMSAKRGLRQFGNAGAQAIMSDLEQLVYRKVMEGRSANDLTTGQKRAALKYLMFLKQKRCGKIKGCGCADGRKHWMYKSKDETSSPTISTEALFLTCLIDAMEGRCVVTCDVPGAFMQTDIDELVHLKLEGEIAELLVKVDPSYGEFMTKERGKLVIYTELNKALYGTLQAALLFLKDMSKFLVEELGFIVNPYDWCVVNKTINGKQCTIGWHVDDLKISHVDTDVVEGIIQALDDRFVKEAPLVVHRGRVQEYLGMVIDFTATGKVGFSMPKYVEELLSEAPEEIMKGSSTTPAASHLFQTNPDALKLNATDAIQYHHLVDKLLYLAKRTRPDLLTAISFLAT